jgi:hypothetical protein
LSSGSTGRLLLPGFLPEQPLLEQGGLVAERLAGQVDVPLRRLEVGVSARAMSAAGDVPAAAAFVIDVCLPSWNGRIGLSIFARLSAVRSVAA